MKNAVITFAFLIMVIGIFAQSGYQTATYADVVMVYRTLADNQTLEFTITAPTSGWVAVGFRNNNVMQGGNIIIGYAVGTVVSVRDDYGTGTHTHVSDTSLGGTSNFAISGGGDQGGSTMLELQIPLDSGDTYDPPMAIGSSYSIIMAYGSSDSYSGQHTNAGFATVNILGAVSNDDLVNPASQALKLHANFPNPFASSTSLQWTQIKDTPVELAVFNSRGQIVFHKVISETVTGNNSFLWNGADQSGNKLTSGFYWIRVSQDGETDSRKIILLK